MGMTAMLVALALGVVPGTGTRNDAACAGGAAFTFTFKAQSTSQVHVYKDGVEVTTGFTKALNANQDSSPGGTVTFDVAPTCTTLRVQRETPKTQSTVYTPYSAFPAKTTEKALDNLVMQGQEVDRRVADAEATHVADEAARDAERAGDLAAQAVRDQGQDNALANVGTGIATGDSLVTATGSTAARKLKDRAADVVNVKDFGAVGDGIADDTAAIQAAIDAVKPDSVYVNAWASQAVRKVLIPRGRYKLTASLKTYTGVWLDGDGETSRLWAAPGFAGTAIIKGEPIAAQSWLQHPRISNLGFESAAGSGIWAFQQTVDWIVRGRFENLTLWTSKGLDLAPYCQSSVVERVTSYGAIDQLLHLRGNANVVSQLDKEGDTGTTADPYILVEANGDTTPPSGRTGASGGNRFQQIIIEGATSANKSLVKFDGTADTTLEDFWLETAAGSTDGYALRVNQSKRLAIRGLWTNTIKDRSEIALTNESSVSIERLQLDANIPTVQTDRIEDVVSVDSSSYLEVGALTYGFLRGDLLPSSPRIKVRAVEDRQTIDTPVAGVQSMLYRPHGFRHWHNLLVNPSFEAGGYGTAWSVIAGAAATATYETSEVAPGLMVHLNYAAGTFSRWLQPVTVPAAWVGREMTVSFLAKLTNASATAIVFPAVSGGGLVPSGNEMAARSGEGWQRLHYTFVPQAAGTVYVGAQVNFAATADVYLDEFMLSLGDDGSMVGGFRAEQIELSGRSVTYASAEPASGTWKAGDVVLNSEPSAAEPSGWRCTAGGTPGTWTAIPGQAAAQADSVAADIATLKTDFNALLAKLRTAGALAP